MRTGPSGGSGWCDVATGGASKLGRDAAIKGPAR